MILQVVFLCMRSEGSKSLFFLFGFFFKTIIHNVNACMVDTVVDSLRRTQWHIERHRRSKHAWFDCSGNMDCSVATALTRGSTRCPLGQLDRSWCE